MNLSFLFKGGVIAPEFFYPVEDGFLSNISCGMFFTGGLRNAGGGNRDDDGRFYPTHGRISQTPARNSYARCWWEGDDYLMELGYDEAARICLNHSFAVQRLDTGIGKLDVTPEEETRMNALLTEMQYDDYDRLGQCVDCVAMAEGPAEIEKRMQDVKNRYGNYPQEKWDKHLELGRYFSEKAGKSGIFPFSYAKNS